MVYGAQRLSHTQRVWAVQRLVGATMTPSLRDRTPPCVETAAPGPRRRSRDSARTQIRIDAQHCRPFDTSSHWLGASTGIFGPSPNDEQAYDHARRAYQGRFPHLGVPSHGAAPQRVLPRSSSATGRGLSSAMNGMLCLQTVPGGVLAAAPIDMRTRHCCTVVLDLRSDSRTGDGPRIHTTSHQDARHLPCAHRGGTMRSACAGNLHGCSPCEPTREREQLGMDEL